MSSKQHAAIEHVGELAQSLMMQLARLEGGVSVLDGSVTIPAAAAAAVGLASPAAAAESSEVAALHVKLRELEARHRTREAEAAELVESTRRLASVESERAKRELAAVLESKNAEVDAFRCELDAIVLDIKLMHANQSEAAAFAARQAARKPRVQAW